MRRLLAVLLLALLATPVASPASAAQCGGDFQTFLAQISREAQAQGVSGAVIGRGPGWPDGKIFSTIALPWIVHVLKSDGE